MTSYPSWPSGVPWCPVRNTTRGGPQDARISFQPDAGVAIERPRTTAAVEIYDVTMAPWTVSEFEIFRAWFEGDLAFGSLPFAWYHPITREVTRWKFAPGEPYTIAQAAKGYIMTSFRAVRLPGATWFAPYLPAGTLLVPDLVIDFAAQVYGIAGVRKTFADLITFTRAGAANYVDAAGATQSAPANTPRFDHDPSTHAALGLLMDDTDGDSAFIGPARWPLGLFATEGTMLVVCRSQQVTSPTYRNVFAARGVSTDDRVDVVVNQSAVAFRAVVGAVSQATNGHGAYTLGNRVAVAGAFAANSFRSSRDGGAVVTDSAGTVPVMDRAYFGQGEDQVRIEKVICWNSALTSAELQALSA